MSAIKKLSLSGMFVALGLVCSAFYIPMGASKCFPVQHMINVLAGVLLGPVYGVGIAFGTSFLRVIMGTGTLLAFPGSMIGAFFCGLLYQKTKKLSFAYMGEIVGTGIIGALVAYPVAILIMGKEAAMFAYLLPFLVSSFGGASISIVFIGILRKAKVLHMFGIS